MIQLFLSGLLVWGRINATIFVVSRRRCHFQIRKKQLNLVVFKNTHILPLK